jgi:hypothetical protein
MLRRVALVRIDISEGLSASFISVKRMCELGTTLAVYIRQVLVTDIVVRSTPTLVTVMKEVLSSIRRSIPEDAVLHSHHIQNFMSHIRHVLCKIMSNNVQGM